MQSIVSTVNVNHLIDKATSRLPFKMSGEDTDDNTSQDDDEEFPTLPQSPVAQTNFRRECDVSGVDSDTSPPRSLDALMVNNQSCESGTEADNQTITWTNNSVNVCRPQDGLPHENPETVAEGLPTGGCRTAGKPSSTTDTPEAPNPAMQEGLEEELLFPEIFSSESDDVSAVHKTRNRDHRRRAKRHKVEPSRSRSKSIPMSDYKLSSCNDEGDTDTSECLECELPQCQPRTPTFTAGSFVSLATLRQSPNDDPEGIQIIDHLLGLQGKWVFLSFFVALIRITSVID